MFDNMIFVWYHSEHRPLTAYGINRRSMFRRSSMSRAKDQKRFGKAGCRTGLTVIFSGPLIANCYGQEMGIDLHKTQDGIKLGSEWWTSKSTWASLAVIYDCPVSTYMVNIFTTELHWNLDRQAESSLIHVAPSCPVVAGCAQLKAHFR
jgi:hypothetical protein